MKKQIVTACALIASVAAFAASVTSDNTFGVLKISSQATAVNGKQMIIPIPWVTVGGTVNQIAVTNYVLTTGRTKGEKGDKILWYDQTSGKYSYYYIDSKTGNWTAASQEYVNDEGYAEELTPPDNITRGSAAILALVAGSIDPIYLSGQYSTSNVVTTVYGLKEGEHETYPLLTKSTWIAPPQAGEYTLSSATYGTALGDDGNPTGNPTMNGDIIVLSTKPATNYVYGTAKATPNADSETTGWYYPGPTSNDFNVKIPSGVGAVYMRCNDGDIYIKW